MRVSTQGLFRLCLKTFVAPFLPARLTAPGSPRMILLRPCDEELLSMIGEANARQNTNNHEKIAAQSLENDGNHENSKISKLKLYQCRLALFQRTKLWEDLLVLTQK